MIRAILGILCTLLLKFFLCNREYGECPLLLLFKQALSSVETISRQLAELARSGAVVAIWGGTGKSAAFMHQFNVDAIRFPLVVDSDPDKVGTFVPGTGQKIVFRDALKGILLDVVIIPTHWRAKDIIAEMSREEIYSKVVLVEHDGQLVEPRW